MHTCAHSIKCRGLYARAQQDTTIFYLNTENGWIEDPRTRLVKYKKVLLRYRYKYYIDRKRNNLDTYVWYGHFLYHSHTAVGICLTIVRISPLRERYLFFFFLYAVDAQSMRDHMLIFQMLLNDDRQTSTDSFLCTYSHWAGRSCSPQWSLLLTWYFHVYIDQYIYCQHMVHLSESPEYIIFALSRQIVHNKLCA